MSTTSKLLQRMRRLPPTTSESSAVIDEEALFRQRYAELKLSRRPKAVAERDPPKTLATIPTFYQPLPNAADCIGQKLREESRTLFLQKRSRELLDNSELKQLWSLLDGAHHQTTPPPPPPPPSALPSASDAAVPSAADKYINYDSYLTVRRAAGPRFRRYLTSGIFARLQSMNAVSGPTPPGRVSIHALFNYVIRRVWMQQTRIGLSLYDYTGQGYLREPNLDAYILELIPTLPQLEGLERSFHSFYVCTAVRKFFFFLDPLGIGRIRIRDILASAFLDDLLELRDYEPMRDPLSSPHINWFSAPSALSVYGHYLNLDRDHNGMLSRAELAGYGSGTLTSVFLERVFAECHTYNGEMDYKTYLDFVLALENRGETQSLQYLFRLLDVDRCGYLDAFTLRYFFRGIEEQIVAHRAERVCFDDVKDEIFDMVRPARADRITLADLLRCGQGETVVSILIEFHKFWAYENRENVVADAAAAAATSYASLLLPDEPVLDGPVVDNDTTASPGDAVRSDVSED